MSSDSDSARNRVNRAHSAKYGGVGAWACRPQRCSIMSRADSSERLSSDCRASVARPSARFDMRSDPTVNPLVS